MLKGYLRQRIKSIGSWGYDRLNLSRDATAIRAFDFGSTELSGVRDLMAKYAMVRREPKVVNWLLPYVKNPLFAGVFTILRFADYFRSRKGIHNNIIVYDCSGRRLADIRENIRSVFPLLANNVHGLRRGPDPLPSSDITIASCWQSAFWLLQITNTSGKFYFVQDFEPLFYPASATSGLVESTYRLGYWGIANTKHLGRLLQTSYGMTVSAFDPAVDRDMFYPAADRITDPLRIVFYGRPGNPRNGFMLGVEALKQVKARFRDRVCIISAGGKWNPSDYGAKGAIENVGVLTTIRHVAELYRSCHIGLFFMFTQHPSYQPLELMASGVTVVTNNNPAIRSFLRDRQNSLIVEPSVTATVEAISRLVEDGIYRNELAVEGLKTAAQTSWESQIEDVYSFLAGRREKEVPELSCGSEDRAQFFAQN